MAKYMGGGNPASGPELPLVLPPADIARQFGEMPEATVKEQDRGAAARLAFNLDKVRWTSLGHRTSV